MTDTNTDKPTEKKEHDIDYADPDEESKGTFDQKVIQSNKVFRWTYQRWRK